MRVMHFRQVFTALTETFIHDTVVEMERQGVDCQVLALRRIDLPGRPFDRVSLVRLPHRLGPRRVAQKLASVCLGRDRERLAAPMIRRGIAERIDAIRPDVIHAHFGPDADIIAPIAADRGIPLVATFYGYDFSVRRVLERHAAGYQRLFAQAAAIVGVSRHACERLARLGADEYRLELVRLGVRTADFPPQAAGRRETDDTGRVRCLHVGRLVPKKSPVELVEAFAAAVGAAGEDIELTLTIVGDGPLREAVIRRAAELGVSGRVELKGALPRVEGLRLMARSDIHVQHSVTDLDGDQEGQPVSLVEAAATGLPIVSTRHSGIPEVVSDGRTGFLVDEHDVGSMGERIARLARDPALRFEMGAAGRQHIERVFSLERETTRLIEILERAAAGGVRLKAPAGRAGVVAGLKGGI